MTDAVTYAAAYPEIAIAVGAMAILMLGAFRPDTDANGRLAGWLAVIVLAFAGGLVLAQPDEKVSLFNGAFIVDPFGRFVKLLVLAGSALTIILSLDYFTRHKLMKFELPVLILLGTVGMMMMVSAGDFVGLYLGVELHSLASYVLAAIRRDDVRSSEAGLKYFVLGALASGMLLYGASLVYGFTGSTNFAVIASTVQSDGSGAGVGIGLVVGLVFLLAGLAFKISAVPFHMWTPDVYEGSPTPITAFFAAAPKVAAIAMLVRVLMAGFPDAVSQWQQIIIFSAIASMLLGAFAAIGQTNIKRLMAYSSIGHVGFALVGLAAASNDGTASILIYLAIYMATTLGVFAVILAMRRGDEMVEDIYDLSGLAQTNLKMAAILALLLFSLAGVPPLAGFFAKWYVFAAAVKTGLYPLAVIGVLASVVSCFYYLRIVKVMFFDEPKPGFAPPDASLNLIMSAAGLFVLAYVLWPGPLVDAANAAAATLRF
jgi:NADH-quinone oxidoreductase subunit N